jgi:hypothetical protein
MKIEKKVPLPLLKRQKKKRRETIHPKKIIFLWWMRIYTRGWLRLLTCAASWIIFFNVKRGSDTVKVFYSKNI